VDMQGSFVDTEGSLADMDGSFKICRALLRIRAGSTIDFVLLFRPFLQTYRAR